MEITVWTFLAIVFVLVLTVFCVWLERRRGLKEVARKAEEKEIEKRQTIGKERVEFETIQKAKWLRWNELHSEAKDVGRLARKFLSGNYLILDTETTGLSDLDQIIEICIINTKGEVLLDTLVKPKQKMKADSEASRVHGITNALVQDAPLWPEVYLKVKEFAEGCDGFIIYNASFDARMIIQSCDKYDLPYMDADCYCLMELFACWYGELRDLDGDYRWHKLWHALGYCNGEIQGIPHRAKSDCLATLEILKYLAENPALTRKFI